MPYLRQSKRLNLSFYEVKKFFSDFNKKLTNTKKTWDGNLIKNLPLLLSEVFQHCLSDLDHISVVVLLYDEMRLLYKRTGNNFVE